MIRFLIYIILVAGVLYFLSRMGQRQGSLDLPSPQNKNPQSLPKASKRWFRPKRDNNEPWVQVYETASMDEARVLQARLQEEEVECVLYEQGKKDIHGNALKGVGIAVPKTAMTLAQNMISRLLS